MKDTFKILIKNMVCPRCLLSVESIFQELQIPISNVELGEVTLLQPLSVVQLHSLNEKLKSQGFELIETRVQQLIENIKLIAADYLSKSGVDTKTKLSSFISERIPYDYSYLSDLFSGVEGKSIEQYFIELRIEKVKELIVYDQVSFTEIAFRTGFSSVHHLSAQFKKITGLTPSHFKTIGASKRKPLDTI